MPHGLGLPTILVVEDEPMIAILMESELADDGFVPVLASSVREALDYVAQRRIDAAVLDYSLADGTCCPIAERLYALGIPFAICTGMSSFSMEESFPGITVLTKPFDGGELVDVVRNLMAAERSVA